MDEFNYFSQLLEMKDDDGRDFFVNIKAGRVCQDCMKLEYEEMILCDHVEQTAHWKDTGKHKKTRKLYENGMAAKGARELKGIIASDFSAAFDKKLIKRCFELPRFINQGYHPKDIFVAADPSGGGPSKMALASGYILDNVSMVVKKKESFFFKFFLSIYFFFKFFFILTNGHDHQHIDLYYHCIWSRYQCQILDLLCILHKL